MRKAKTAPHESNDMKPIEPVLIGERAVGRFATVVCSARVALFGVMTVFAPEHASAVSKPLLPPGARVLRDLDYVEGGYERNRLDLCLPESTTRPTPVIVLSTEADGWVAARRCPAIRFATND